VVNRRGKGPDRQRRAETHTVDTDGSPSTSSSLMPLTFMRWRRGAG